MSTNGKANICTASNSNEMTRPLSTYDNLNTNDTKLTTASSLSSSPSNSNGTHMDGNQSNPNVTESPFNGITFRFDDIKQPQYDGGRMMTTTATTTTTNGYDNISNSEYEQHRNHNNNNNNNSSNSNSNNSSSGMNMGRGNQVTTIAQNHLLETVDAVLKPNRSNAKPVHSEAKSQFLGLNATANGGGGNNERNGDSVDGSIDRDHTNEDEPLLHKVNGNRSILMTPHRSQAQTQYQNLPNNSACYGQNQIIDANDACTCKTLPDNGIRSMNSDRYECDSCIESNNNVKRMEANAIPTTSADANAASSTITHMASSSYLMSESLSQAVYMSTTVPQNIKSNDIMGSHLPTRQSLRHSRMLVGKNKFPMIRRRNPLGIRHPRTVKYLFNFHILVGLIISSLGLWLCWWAPSTRARENPYWSGLILMLSGILGLIVIAFKPIPRQKLRQHFITFLRVNSTLVTIIAASCTLIASSFACLHLINILSPTTECRPVHMLVDSSACTCSFDIIPPSNETQHSIPKVDGEILSGSYYRDLSCNEVMGPFKYILIASAISNFVGFIICSTLLVLLCLRRKPAKRVPYNSANSGL